jgi:hypothetical protein
VGAIGQSIVDALSTVNAFWAIRLGFHFHSLFSMSECWAIGLGFHFLSFFSSFIFSFPFSC